MAKGHLLQAAQVHRAHRRTARCRRASTTTSGSARRPCARSTPTGSTTTGTGSGRPATATSATRACTRWTSPAGRWARRRCPSASSPPAASSSTTTTRRPPTRNMAIFEYADCELVFEVRGLMTGSEASIAEDEGFFIGNMIFGSEGYMSLDPVGCQIYLGEKRELAREIKHKEVIWDTAPHMANFLAAVRSRKHRRPHVRRRWRAPLGRAGPHGQHQLPAGAQAALRPGARKLRHATRKPTAFLRRAYRKPYVVPEQVSDGEGVALPGRASALPRPRDRRAHPAVDERTLDQPPHLLSAKLLHAGRRARSSSPPTAPAPRNCSRRRFPDGAHPAVDRRRRHSSALGGASTRTGGASFSCAAARSGRSTARRWRSGWWRPFRARSLGKCSPDARGRVAHRGHPAGRRRRAGGGACGRARLALRSRFPAPLIHPQFHPLEPEWIEFAGDPAPRMHRVRRDGTGMECLYQHGNDEFVVHETFPGRRRATWSSPSGRAR